MNIFVTNPCPRKSAEYLDDKRVIKMATETSQMLSTAIRKKMPGLEDNRLCKQTHPHHNCTIWCGQSKQNFLWAIDHMIALNDEYVKRYKKTNNHFCMTRLDAIREYLDVFPDIGQTPFQNCAANKEFGVSFKHIEDVHIAYRMYLNERWKTDKRTPTRYKKPILPIDLDKVK